MTVADTRQSARVILTRIERANTDSVARLGAVRDQAARLRSSGDPFVAFELCRARPAAVTSAPASWIKAMVEGGPIDRWELTDCCGSFVTGVAWREGAIDDAHVAKWARSKDPWARRLALVSTVPLNCRARGATECDAPRTLAVCEMLVDDRHDMVVKAMSWALRELAKRDAAAVKAFLRTHGEGIAARVRREVGNKLTTGLKNPPGSAKTDRKPSPRRATRA